MATTLDPKQIVSFEELLMFQVIQQEALTRLLVEKGIFSKEEFLEMVKVVNLGIKRERGLISCQDLYIFMLGKSTINSKPYFKDAKVLF